jgi:hypothetical protein
MEGVGLRLKWASVFMACTGAVFTFLSFVCFLFSVISVKSPSISQKFVAEVLESAFLFAVAAVLLIVGVVFLVYAAEFELRL